jgi:hypothetical protein
MKGARGGLASIRPPNGRCQVVSINGVAAGGEELTLEVLWQEWLLVLAAPQLW